VAGQQTRGRRRGTADTSGTATASDLAEERRARRGRDAPLERAYNAGRRGDDPAEFQTDDELYGYYQDGRSAARAESRSERIGSVRERGGSVANDGAGIILGLVGYALLVNYLQGGVAGTRAWLAAKFLNRPSGDAARARPPATPARPAGARP
jgi:hypothetical protein